jgi:RNA-directed DNA polymerase
VVQGALRFLLEPIFEVEFADTSFGFRPQRSGHDALHRVVEHLDSGFTWVVDADLRCFFDTMDHEVLMTRLQERVSDGRILSLIEAFLHQEVMEGLERWTPEAGSPQGAVVSPLLSNIFLDPLDHRLARKGFAMVRYADDFVILCRSRTEAERALREVRGWVEEVGLVLHPEKTRIVDVTRKGGFDFLGYHFERGHSWPSKKSLQRFKATIRRQTKRTNGHSLETILSLINRRSRGWYQYFRYSSGGTFGNLDGWIRMRLRSILRKRHHGRGRGRGRDHQRWPNSFFAERGLLSLLAAYEAAGRPSWR